MADRSGTADDGSVAHATLLTDPRLVAILLASGIGLFGTNAIAPALPAVADRFGVPGSEIGLVMSAFFLPVVAAIPVTGVLADIYGRRRLVLWGLAVFGAAGLAIAVVDDFRVLLALRVLQGLGFAGVTPMAMTVIGDLYAGAAGSTAQGYRVGTHGLVQIGAPIAGGVLADLAWNYPFVLYAATAPVLLFAWRSLPETAGHQVGSIDRGVRAELRAYWRSIRAEAFTRDLALLAGGGFAMFVLKFAVITFVPLYVVRTLGGSATLAGLLTSVLGGVRLLVSPASGAVVARLSRQWTLVGAAAVAAAGAAAIPLAGSRLGLAAVIGAYSVGDALFTPTLNDAVTAAASDEHRGGVVSAVNIVKNTGNMLSPAILGLVFAAFGFGVLFGVASAAVLGFVAAGTVLGLSFGDR